MCVAVELPVGSGGIVLIPIFVPKPGPDPEKIGIKILGKLESGETVPNSI